MARIANYQTDSTLTDDTKLLGTAQDQGQATANYGLAALTDYHLASGFFNSYLPPGWLPVVNSRGVMGPSEVCHVELRRSGPDISSASFNLEFSLESAGNYRARLIVENFNLPYNIFSFAGQEFRSAERTFNIESLEGYRAVNTAISWVFVTDLVVPTQTNNITLTNVAIDSLVEVTHVESKVNLRVNGDISFLDADGNRQSIRDCCTSGPTPPPVFVLPTVSAFSSSVISYANNMASFSLTVSFDLNDYHTAPSVSITDAAGNSVPLTGVQAIDGVQNLTTATLSVSSLPQRYTLAVSGDNSAGDTSSPITRVLDVNIPATRPSFTLSAAASSFTYPPTPTSAATSFELFDAGTVLLTETIVAATDWTIRPILPTIIPDVVVTSSTTTTQSVSRTRVWDFAVSHSDSPLSVTRNYSVTPQRSFRYGSMVPTMGMSLDDTIRAMAQDRTGLGNFTVWDNGTNTEIAFPRRSPVGTITLNIIANSHIYLLYDAALPSLRAITQQAGIVIDYLASNVIVQREDYAGYKVYTSDGLAFAPGTITLTIS